MTITTRESRPDPKIEAAPEMRVTAHPQDTETLERPHLSAAEIFDRPAPVDAREDGLHRWDFGPVPPLDHPRHPLSDFNLYDCPEPAPWGSYLDTTPLPLPPGGGGPIAYAMDVLAAREVAR